MEDLEKTCFVISPIGSENDKNSREYHDVFEYLIKKPIEETGRGFKVTWAKDFLRAGSYIIKDIVKYLKGAHIVVANLTGKNPNVLYELGVRHAYSPRTILIAKSKDDLPTNLDGIRLLFYENSIGSAHDFPEKIRECFEDILKNPDELENPVYDGTKTHNNGIAWYSSKFDLPLLLKRMNAKRESQQWVIPAAIKKKPGICSLPGKVGGFELYVVKEKQTINKILYVFIIDQTVDIERDLIENMSKLIKEYLDAVDMKITFLIASERDLGAAREIITKKFAKIPRKNARIILKILDKPNLNQDEDLRL